MKIQFLLLIAPLLLTATFRASAALPKAKPSKATATARPISPRGPFRDVPPNHWAAQAVETLRQKGIVHGYPSPARVKAR